jgi:ABC transport system ATP-binding/permease protein
MGKNGSGKSTLLNLLNKNLKPDAGTIKWYEHLRIVTFDQQREQLNKNQTLWKALAPDGDSVLYKGQSIHVAAWAKRFLFPPDQLHQSISRLSGGEQARVLIANLMLKPADLLLLDEPTNDLDIPTLEVLENSLAEFEGAIVLITHDRYFLERLSTCLLYLNGEGKAEFFADYAQWFENQSTNKKTIEMAETSQSKKKTTYEQQKELNRIPDKIRKAETELETLQNQLVDSSIVNDQKQLIALCQKIEVAKNKIEQLYKRWEELDS